MDAALAGWDDFFLGAAGAAAALAGLLFVAISINVREILADAALPARAGETIVFAVAPLAVSLLVLMPDQSVRVVGVEVLVVALGAWFVTSRRRCTGGGARGDGTSTGGRGASSSGRSRRGAR